MKKRSRRMHSEDARFLREMFMMLTQRIFELEVAVGELQRAGAARHVNETVVDEALV